jgi:hypothetical protein
MAVISLFGFLQDFRGEPEIDFAIAIVSEKEQSGAQRDLGDGTLTCGSHSRMAFGYDAFT